MFIIRRIFSYVKKLPFQLVTQAARLYLKFLQKIILEKHFLVLYSYDILMEENQTCWNLNKIYGVMWPLV